MERASGSTVWNERTERAHGTSASEPVRSEREDDIADIAAGLASSFDEPVYDVDRAVGVYADYLERNRHVAAARRLMKALPDVFRSTSERMT